MLFGATYGATVVFFEMLTGQLPIAFAWLGALTLAAARDEHQPAGMAPAVSVGAALGAFCLSAVLTVLIKQCLAVICSQSLRRLPHFSGTSRCIAACRRPREAPLP